MAGILPERQEARIRKQDAQDYTGYKQRDITCPRLGARRHITGKASHVPRTRQSTQKLRAFSPTSLLSNAKTSLLSDLSNAKSSATVDSVIVAAASKFARRNHSLMNALCGVGTPVRDASTSKRRRYQQAAAKRFRRRDTCGQDRQRQPSAKPTKGPRLPPVQTGRDEELPHAGNGTRFRFRWPAPRGCHRYNTAHNTRNGSKAAGTLGEPAEAEGEDCRPKRGGRCGEYAKRMAEQQKQELAEQRKLEQQLKRQKLLEDYKRKKIEQELGEPASGANSARGSGSSSSATTPNRGHSQPPFGRPKSQSNMHSIHARTLQRPGRTQSSVVDENASPRIFVPSTAEPSLKLFAKAQPKSNRSLIMNALQYSIFPGAVSNEQRNKVQGSIAQSDSKHFLVLFRDHKCQYRGLYTWDQVSDTLHKVDGSGPKVCREDMISLMFKYDSGAKKFANIPTKHLSATIDGFTIQDQYWLKPKIPHSGGR